MKKGKISKIITGICLISILSGCSAKSDSPAQQPQQSQSSTNAQSNSKTKLAEYKATIESKDNVVIMKPNEARKININVKNVSNVEWNKAVIDISYHILDSNNQVIVRDGKRTQLPKNLKSNEELNIDMTLVAPAQEGKYKIEIDMVHEGVTWFAKSGSQTKTIDLEVKK